MSRLPLRRVAGALKRRLWLRRELRIYACTAEQVRHLPRASHCSRDRWDDLRHCEQWSYEHLTREEYLAVTEDRRRAGGHHLYSLVEDGVLVHYGWVTYPQERAPDAALGLEFVPPPRSAALWDYFTHPKARGRGLYLRTLWQCLHDAVEVDGAAHAFIYVYADNVVSRRVIEKAGFEYVGSLVLERRFFRTRRYAISAGAPLEVRLLASGEPAETREHRGAMLGLEHDEKGENVVQPRNDSARQDQLGPRRSGHEAV
ncbi:MAG TPA: GNAT family N-acetyltransferase [Vicinamibacterales bacterium]|nr:GNAT family N-acetyltransferase [Vicinamibacterales bacterium]